MNEFNKIDDFFKNQNTPEIQNVSLFRNGNGYELFYKYNIKKIDNLFEVSYKFNYTVKYFSSLLNAFSYCIFDHRNKIPMAQKIENLDFSLRSLNFEVIRYHQLISNTKLSDETLIYSAKLNESMVKLSSVKKEISYYTKESINWQEKQFKLKNKSQ
jgi:hypothetical protein